MKIISIICALFLLSNITTLNVPICYDQSYPNIPNFVYTVNGTNDDTTKAYICHDQESLFIHWWNIDDQVISTYEKCNDPLYNQDAVEIFIATNASYPNHYFELQVSPKGQLFFADITNPTGYCSKLQTMYYPCTSVDYSGKVTNKGWEATLKISKNCTISGLQIIGRGQKLDYFKGNIFRIDKSSAKPTRYLSYKKTNSPPCFHQPQYFTDFVLVYE